MHLHITCSIEQQDFLSTCRYRCILDASALGVVTDATTGVLFFLMY